MKTVVTGASGHVGANLVRRLLAQGAEVRTLVHDDRAALDGLDTDEVRGNVLDIGSLYAAFDGADLVYHLAARISIVGDPDGRVQATNVVGAENAARAALAQGVRRFVHVSSIHAYDVREGRPILDEDSGMSGPQRPAYDRTKAEGQARVLAVIGDGLDGVIVNPVGVLGPWDFRPSRMGQFFVDLARQRLPGLVAGGFTWVDVRDLAATLIAAAERGKTGRSYLVGGSRRTMAELAAIAEEITGVPAPRFTSPLWMARLFAPPMEGFARWTGREPLYTREALEAVEAHPVVADARARDELGHAPRAIEETIRDSYQWFVDHGRLDLQLPPAAAP